MKYKVINPNHSYTEQIIDANDMEKAIEIAMATNSDTEQLIDNVEQDGDVEIEEMGN